METDSATVYPFEIDGKIHSLLRIPSSLPESITEKCGPNPQNMFSVVMADVSGSMEGDFEILAEKWTSIVSPNFKGIYNLSFSVFIIFIFLN